MLGKIFAILVLVAPFTVGCTIMLPAEGSAYPANPQQAAVAAPAPEPVAENAAQPSEPAASPSVTPSTPFLPIRPLPSVVRPANPVGSIQIRPPSRISRPTAPVHACPDCVRREPPKAQTPIRRSDPPRLVPQPKKTPPKPDPVRGIGLSRLAQR